MEDFEGSEDSEEVEEYDGYSSRIARLRIVDKYFTSNRFDEFFEDFKAQKIRDGDAS